MKNEARKFIQIILIGLFSIGLFFVSNLSVKADPIQELLNQNTSLVLDQSKEQTQATAVPLDTAAITNSGTDGTCTWDIDDTGRLTIHPGTLGAGPSTGWYNFKSSITSVYVEPGVKANANSEHLFSDMANVKTIDITNLDTSKAQSLSGFFDYDSKLENIIGLENLDTSSATNLSYMFRVTSSLDEIDVSHFDTKNVTNMSYMFSSYSGIITGLRQFDTSQVTNMSGMFLGTTITNTDDIKDWNTSKVTNMSSLFKQCDKLTSVDLTGWNKSNVTNISGMFTWDTALTDMADIKGLKGWITSRITNMDSTFAYTKFTQMTDVEGWDTSSVTNMNNTFGGCNKLTSLDLSEWNTSNVTDMGNMFNGDKLLNEDTLIGIQDFKTSKVKTFSYMFSYTGFKVLDLSNFDTSSGTNFSNMFNNTASLTKIIGNFDTSKATDLSNMFNNSAITDFSGLNISDWKTDKVQNFSNMFSQTNFTSLPEITNWKTNSATNFSTMFSQMSKLTSLDLSNWNTSNATNMSGMFGHTSSLATINSNFDTAKVTDMSNMFAGSYIKALDTSKWDTGKVTNMKEMFMGASKIGKLDLSNWDMSKVTDMTDLFNGANNIWQLRLGPKNVFTDDAKFPKLVTASFTDQEENKQYTSISGYWQVVDEENGGTPHEPVGKLISNDDLNTLYSKSGGPTATYVPQQKPYIDMQMDVPDLSFRKTGSNKMVVHRQEDNWGITVTNNTFPSKYVQGDIKVKMSEPLTDINGNDLNGSLIFRESGRDRVIGSDDTLIRSTSFPKDASRISWARSNGFLMDFDGSTVKAGDYSGKLTWTLQNSI